MPANIKDFLEPIEAAVAEAQTGPDLEGNTSRAMTPTDEAPAVSQVKETPVASESAASSFLEFISKGEGGYESSNRGTQNDRIIGSTNNTIRDGKALSAMTIQEIMAKQKLGIGDENRLFAVGKYQIIPDTLSMAVKALGLSEDTVFSPDVQEQLGLWLLFKKRPKLGAYLKGDSSNLNEALREAAYEWASLPNPATGLSFYGKGNKAQHSVSETTAALKAARESYLNQFAPTSAPAPQIKPE